MNYSDFEYHIKEKLYNNQSSVDTGYIIDIIHKDQNNRKKRKYFGILVFLTLLFSLVGGYTLLNKYDNLIDKPDKTSITNEKKTNHNFQEKKREIATKITSLETSKTDIINKDNPIKSTIVNNEKHIAKNPVLSKNILPVNTSNIKKVIDKNQEKQSVIIREKTVNISGFKKLEIKKSMLADKNPELKLSLDTKEIKCYSFKDKSAFSMQLGFELGVYKPFKKLENLDMAENEIFEIRNKYEEPLEALRAAAFMRIKNKVLPVYLMLGGAYTRITDRLKYDFSYVVQDTVQGIISITKSENGDTLTVIYGDIIRDIEIEKKVVKHYYFHLIDIPVAIGYEFNLKNYKINTEIGIIFNLNTNTSGYIIDANKEFVPVNNSDLFKNSTKTSFFTAINFIKPISNKSEMFLNIKGRYIPENFSNSTNTIRQNYQLTGMNIGFLYYFE